MCDSRQHQLSREQDSHPLSTPGPMAMARSWPSLPPGAEDSLAPCFPGKPKAQPRSVKTELITGPSLGQFSSWGPHSGGALGWNLALHDHGFSRSLSLAGRGLQHKCILGGMHPSGVHRPGYHRRKGIMYCNKGWSRTQFCMFFNKAQ